jgi:hypothetical protein
VVLSATFSVSQLIRTTTNITSIATADAGVNADGLGALNLSIGNEAEEHGSLIN